MFKEIPEKSKAAQLLIKEASCDCEERQAKVYRKIETYLWISTIIRSFLAEGTSLYQNIERGTLQDNCVW